MKYKGEVDQHYPHLEELDGEWVDQEEMSAIESFRHGIFIGVCGASVFWMLAIAVACSIMAAHYG